MATSSFKDLIKVCEALGLERKKTKSGIIYKGMANGKYCRISIHLHSIGNDIASGTYQKYVKDLGFETDSNFKRYLSTIK